MSWKTLTALAAALGLLGLIPACPAPSHPDVYEGGTYTGDDDVFGDDDVGDDDVGDDDVGDDDVGDDDTGVPPDDDDTTPEGPDVLQFFNDYVNAFCGRALECYDPATLEHLGWENLAACRQWMNDNSVDPAECLYDPTYAQSCLAQVLGVDCDDFLTAAGMDDCLLALDCS